VVIDVDPAKGADLAKAEVPHVIGSAVSDDVLERAGIERARAIVIGTSTDSDNVFITLAAREHNPRIRIHARGESPPAQRRLRQAGADQVVSAYQMGGSRMAASILRPSVVDFLEISVPFRGEQVDLEEIALDGREIKEIEGETHRLRIVALKRGEETTRLIPDPTTSVSGGDHLVVIGERPSLEKLAQLAQRAAPIGGSA
jgi:voltage-gated potassium channel